MCIKGVRALERHPTLMQASFTHCPRVPIARSIILSPEAVQALEGRGGRGALSTADPTPMWYYGILVVAFLCSIPLVA